MIDASTYNAIEDYLNTVNVNVHLLNSTYFKQYNIKNIQRMYKIGEVCNINCTIMLKVSNRGGLSFPATDLDIAEYFIKRYNLSIGVGDIDIYWTQILFIMPNEKMANEFLIELKLSLS